MADRPMSVHDLVTAVSGGRIGNAEAIRRLNLTSYAELVDTVHANGLSMWAHRRRQPTPETLEVLRRACVGPSTSAGRTTA